MSSTCFCSFSKITRDIIQLGRAAAHDYEIVQKQSVLTAVGLLVTGLISPNRIFIVKESHARSADHERGVLV